IAAKWQTVFKTKSVYGLSVLAQLKLHHSSPGCTRIDLNFLSVKVSRIHRELACLDRFDAGQSCIFPGCPGEGAFNVVIAIEVLKPDFIVCGVESAVWQCQSAI